MGELEDTKNITRNVSQIGHYGTGDYRLSIKKMEDIDYAIQLIFQAYKKIIHYINKEIIFLNLYKEFNFIQVIRFIAFLKFLSCLI